MLKPLTLIAHRGYSSKAPENTIASFDLALKLGYNDIEFDLQLSRDGVVMLMHDEMLERTTNGHGKLTDHTYEQLKQLDAGSWFDPEFAGQQIPTLMELLARYKYRAYLHIELKPNQSGLVGAMRDALEVSGWLEPEIMVDKLVGRRPRLVISSFDRNQLLHSINLLPERIIHELLVENVSQESLLWAAEHGVRSYHPDGKDITPELIKQADKLNLHVGAWWWTREEQHSHFVGKGVRYAYVDEPAAHRRKYYKLPTSS
jgi:glycerophosphoryl diester phosphodiesterase